VSGQIVFERVFQCSDIHRLAEVYRHEFGLDGQ
jgi:hypothetical protein